MATNLLCTNLSENFTVERAISKTDNKSQLQHRKRQTAKSNTSLIRSSLRTIITARLATPQYSVSQSECIGAAPVRLGRSGGGGSVVRLPASMLLPSSPPPLFLPLLLAALIHLCHGSVPTLVRCWVGSVSAVEELHLKNYSLRADVASTYGKPPPLLRVIRCRRPVIHLVSDCAMCLREDRFKPGLRGHEIVLRCLSATTQCPVCIPKRQPTRCSFMEISKGNHRLVTSCCNSDGCSMTPEFNPQIACGAKQLRMVVTTIIMGLFVAWSTS